MRHATGDGAPTTPFFHEMPRGRAPAGPIRFPRNFPGSLKVILEDEHRKKGGVGASEDAQKIAASCGITPRGIVDIVNRGQRGDIGLSHLCQIACRIADWKRDERGDPLSIQCWDLQANAIMVRYAAMDALASLKLLEQFVQPPNLSGTLCVHKQRPSDRRSHTTAVNQNRATDPDRSQAPVRRKADLLQPRHHDVSSRIRDVAQRAQSATNMTYKQYGSSSSIKARTLGWRTWFKRSSNVSQEHVKTASAQHPVTRQLKSS